VVLAAGCSTDPGHPTTLPSLTAAPTPSPTPSTGDLEAAKAVVRRYFTLLNSPTSTAVADALAAMMTAACKCQNVPSSMRTLVNRRQHYFGSSTIQSIAANSDGASAADALVAYTYTAGGIADESGRIIRRSAGRSGVDVDFRLVRRSDRWLIDRIEVVSNGRPT